MSFSLPKQGFVFWPVGTGDSCTICIDKDTVMQVDLNHLAGSKDDDDPRIPIVDELIRLLPVIDGKPYLSTFVLTHPDLDHCRGFKELLGEVTIGELWFAPRVFREYHRDLSDDASAFKKEAQRRLKVAIAQKGSLKPGDRIRIVGHDYLLKEDDYQDLPKELLAIPSHIVTHVDGKDHSASFRAFIHGPFKDDCEGERNSTSIALQVLLKSGEVEGRALLLGDHCYPTVNRIFEISDKGDLKWNVFLAPHHCSKSVMYWQEDGEDSPTLKQKLLNRIESAAGIPAYIISSSAAIPVVNKAGDNPPHAEAKKRYQELVEDGKFLCTHEHPNEVQPVPIIFKLGGEGLEYDGPGSTKKVSKSLSEGIDIARGGLEPPRDRVGFGR